MEGGEETVYAVDGPQIIGFFFFFWQIRPFRSTKCGVRIRHVGGCRIRDALSFLVMDPAGFDDRDIRQESLYRYLAAFYTPPF